MNISPISFNAKMPKPKRVPKFKAPHTNTPYPTSRTESSAAQKFQNAARKDKKYADAYIEQMEEMLEKNPDNKVARMLLNEFKKIK